MLLPQMWVRKLWLQWALKDYPIYDPPHKVEERVLSKEQALENFDYFMRVRQQRVESFRWWLRRYFWTVTQADENGVRALDRWAVSYAGLLLPNREVESGYYSYDPPWTGEGAGCNVLFDMGVAFGEFIIANCPKLRWDMDPISAVRPNEARALKREFGTGFQRPMLTGFNNPDWGKDPIGDMRIYAWQLKLLTTFAGIAKFYELHRNNRRRYKSRLTTIFHVTVKEYLAGDPTTLYDSTGIPTDIGEDDD